MKRLTRLLLVVLLATVSWPLAGCRPTEAPTPVDPPTSPPPAP
jgi:hypothetical protein